MAMQESQARFDTVMSASSVTASSFELWDLLRLVRRRWKMVAATIGVTLVLAVAYTLHHTPIYRATVSLLVDPQALQIIGKDILPSFTSASIDFANVDSQAAVITSTKVLDRVISDLKLDDDPFLKGHGRVGTTISSADNKIQVRELLRSKIVVHRVDNSLVFEIIVSHPNSIMAAKIANTIANVYLRQSAEHRSFVARQASDALLSQTTDLRQQLTRAESAVERFRADHGLISTGTSGLVINQQLQSLTARLSQVEAQVAELKSHADQLRSANAAMILAGAIPEAAASPVITGLRAQYARTVQEEARLSRVLGPLHPELYQVEAARRTTVKLISAELDRIRETALTAYQRGQGDLANLEARIGQVTKSQVLSGEAQIKLRELQSQADATRAVYGAALDRIKELEQQQKLRTNNSHVLSQAVPPLKASGPPIAIVAAAAILFGVAIGTVLAFAREFLLGAAMNAAALGEALNTEVLTVLPHKSKLPQNRRLSLLQPPSDATSLVSTARMIRFLLKPFLPATVLIISASRSQAARRVASGLASALAKLGEPAILCQRKNIPSTSTGGLIASRTQEPADVEFEACEVDSSGVVDYKFKDWSRTNTPMMVSSESHKDEFVLVDAGDFWSLPILGKLPKFDVLIVVGVVGETRAQDLREFEAALGPLRSRLVGLIAVEA